MLRFVDDYRLNLITPDEIKDFGKLSSELGMILELIHVSDDKDGIRDIIMSKQKDYSSVSVSAVDMINTYTSINISKAEEKGGRVNMCKGMQDLLDEIQINDIKNLMKNMKWTAKQAMDALGIKKEEQARFQDML